MTENKLSVIGLGKLGACSAACFAASGFDVIGVDINKDFVDAINAGRTPVAEPRLQEMINASTGRLKAATDYSLAIKDSDITFLIVPTPSKEDGNFSDRYLQDALGHLASALKASNKPYHIFVVTSTVSPGNIDNVLIPLIERKSGRRLGDGFGVAYNPEFIALGSVINDFLNPDMVLIGESSKEVGDALDAIYSKVCRNKPYIARMSVVSAEITKISLNSYVTMKISFANTLGNICESIAGADVDDITRALGADRRISPFYLKSGPSFGGPCFPRDNRAFSAFATRHGVRSDLASSTDTINQSQTERLASIVRSRISASPGNVAVLGLAYKPGTPVIEESPAVKLITELLKTLDIEIIVYDPLACDAARAVFGDNILYASSVKDCISHASVCIVATPEKEFSEIDSSYIINDPTTVIDCWRVLDPSRLGPKAEYIALGKAK
jgi:UDPglucose 6-dehydrogenase